MELKYTRIAALATTCVLLHRYIYKNEPQFNADINYSQRADRTNIAFMLFNIKKLKGEWSYER